MRSGAGGKRLGVGERVTAAVTALSVCHNVTPVYETENTEEGGSLPESDQVGLKYFYILLRFWSLG